VTNVKRLVLDVLKPHAPNTLEFAQALAQHGYWVHIKVEEMDDKTESLMVTVEGASIDFEQVRLAIEGLGGSLHSIDEVEVDGEPGDEPDTVAC